jgi:hypothetical protein
LTKCHGTKELIPNVLGRKTGGSEELKKNCLIFQKAAQTVFKPKKAKISSTKHNLKAQNDLKIPTTNHV